jgi:hypothetical protein
MRDTYATTSLRTYLLVSIVINSLNVFFSLNILYLLSVLFKRRLPML